MAAIKAERQQKFIGILGSDAADASTRCLPPWIPLLNYPDRDSNSGWRKICDTEFGSCSMGSLWAPATSLVARASCCAESDNPVPAGGEKGGTWAAKVLLVET